MTASLTLYRLGAGLLEPLAPLLVRRRIAQGKERRERIGERFGRSNFERPQGPLVWMHGASVGESKLLLDLFVHLRRRRPDVHAVITTQTVTSADMIAAWAPSHVIHQMAPVDGPRATSAFLGHWRPDAAVFAEGEIWPNMLVGLARQRVPAALVNARMTARTLASWNSRKRTAQEIFAPFSFIGAADRATAEGLAAALARPIDVVGNLKIALPPESPAADRIAGFRGAVGPRPILLAASTHPGEDELVLDAFVTVRRQRPTALLILVPRHPERADAIASLARARKLDVQRWSQVRTPPASSTEVLLADTIGELMFWYAACDSVYLGGASVEGVGGHNPIEPAAVGKRVFTGPHGFNFRSLFADLEKAGALTIGEGADALANWWSAELDGPRPAPDTEAIFAAAREPFEKSLAAIAALLEKAPAPKDQGDA